MSVIVLGMEIPENCHVCGLCFGGMCYSCPPEVDEMCPDSGRPDWCPLRPFSEKHGRLIDADALPRYTGDAKPADVRPVVHGKWIKKHDELVYWSECSVCGEHKPVNRWGQEYESDFCPNCGADMRPKNNKEDNKS